MKINVLIYKQMLLLHGSNYCQKWKIPPEKASRKEQMEKKRKKIVYRTKGKTNKKKELITEH